MKDMVIGIVGGTGGMGRWFSRLLQKDGYRVYVSGRKTRLTACDLTGLCNVLVIAVPIAATAETIRQVGPLMKKKSLLMDLTSLKKEPVDLMLENSCCAVIGCHPLFGPSLRNLRDQNVVLCRGRGNEKWRLWLKGVFRKNGLTVMEMTPEEHDKMMAIVQVLNHMNTISFGLALAKTGIPLAEIKKYSTPIFAAKVEIVKKIFKENPGLYADIIMHNPAAMEISALYKKSLAEISVLLRAKDGKKMKDMMVKTADKLSR